METLSEAFERASTTRTDVVLVESSYIKACLMSDGGRELLERAAKKTAIVVLQHQDDSAADAQCMVEAVRLGVVDVIRYPLVKQNTANLWQHSVRKMMADKSNPAMLETLKRSALEPDVNFSSPYRHGVAPGVPNSVALPGVRAAQLAEEQLRSTTPPLPAMSVEAMNLRQAQLLAQMEARKLSEKHAGAAEVSPANKSKASASNKSKASASNNNKSSKAKKGVAAAQAIDWNDFIGTSPDEHAFHLDDVLNFEGQLPGGGGASALPIGLKINYSESFIKKLDLFKRQQKLGMHQPHGMIKASSMGSLPRSFVLDTPDAHDEGSYPGFDVDLLNAAPMDFGNDSYDAIDYVLNSTDFSLESIDDAMLADSLRDGIL